MLIPRGRGRNTMILVFLMCGWGATLVILGGGHREDHTAGGKGIKLEVFKRPQISLEDLKHGGILGENGFFWHVVEIPPFRFFLFLNEVDRISIAKALLRQVRSKLMLSA